MRILKENMDRKKFENNDIAFRCKPLNSYSLFSVSLVISAPPSSTNTIIVMVPTLCEHLGYISEQKIQEILAS